MGTLIVGEQVDGNLNPINANSSTLTGTTPKLGLMMNKMGSMTTSLLNNAPLNGSTSTISGNLSSLTTTMSSLVSTVNPITLAPSSGNSTTNNTIINSPMISNVTDTATAS